MCVRSWLGQNETALSKSLITNNLNIMGKPTSEDDDMSSDNSDVVTSSEDEEETVRIAYFQREF